MIAKRYEFPVCYHTCHEYGRNQGIHNEIQRAIDRQERMLMADADQVIVCSRAMHNELHKVFGCPRTSYIIPNGGCIFLGIFALLNAVILAPHGM